MKNDTLLDSLHPQQINNSPSLSASTAFVNWLKMAVWCHLRSIIFSTLSPSASPMRFGGRWHQTTKYVILESATLNLPNETEQTLPLRKVPLSVAETQSARQSSQCWNDTAARDPSHATLNPSNASRTPLIPFCDRINQVNRLLMPSSDRIRNGPF